MSEEELDIVYELMGATCLAYFEVTEGGVCSLSLKRQIHVCSFVLADAPEDVKNWIMLGLICEENEVVTPLPNWEKYRQVIHDEYPSPERYFELIRRRNRIAIHLPTSVLKQIKPIKGN